MDPGPDPDPDPGLTIVLLGKAGVGKSASGNTILGQPAFESKLDFDSVTEQISEERGTVFGKQISVVDTPGILDTEDTEEEIKEFCQELLQSSRRCLFLVVIRVGRFTDEDQKAVRAARRVLGRQGLKHSYLLFTGGDALKGRSLEDFIFQNRNKGTLPDVVEKFAGACHLFNNEIDDEEQVRQLLLKSGHLSKQPPDSPADESRNRRMVLLGVPGAGKSSSGNTILRSKQFTSGSGFNSVSAETVSGSATVEGRQVSVVDTPGVTDEVLTPEQLYMEIMKSVVEASPGPHAFIIVVRIGRISEADVKLFELLKLLFNSDVCDAHKYCMVLFTHGDNLEGQTMDEMIQSNEHVKQLVSMCAGRFCVFDNKTNRPRQQVRNLLNQIDEMVTANGGQHYTDDMFRMAETFIREERNRSRQTGASFSSPSSDNILKIVLNKMRPYLKKRWIIIACVVGGILVLCTGVGAAAGAAVGATMCAGAAMGAAIGAGAGAGAGVVIGVAAGGGIHRVTRPETTGYAAVGGNYSMSMVRSGPRLT